MRRGGREGGDGRKGRRGPGGAGVRRGGVQGVSATVQCTSRFQW